MPIALQSTTTTTETTIGQILSTKGTARSRITKTFSTGVAALGLLLGTAGAAHADEQSYLDYLFAHGWTYHFGVSAPWAAIKTGEMICANVRAGADPRAGFNDTTNAVVDQTMIDGAQQELCPT